MTLQRLLNVSTCIAIVLVVAAITVALASCQRPQPPGGGLDRGVGQVISQ
jgi:hypothetical protein